MSFFLGGFRTGERPENIRIAIKASSMEPPAICVICPASPCSTRNVGIPIKTAAQTTIRVNDTMPIRLSRAALRLHLDAELRTSERPFKACPRCEIADLSSALICAQVRPSPSFGMKMGS